jgi:hypothetical protein
MVNDLLGAATTAVATAVASAYVGKMNYSFNRDFRCSRRSNLIYNSKTIVRLTAV